MTKSVNVREIMREIRARTSNPPERQSLPLRSLLVPASPAEYDWTELKKAARAMESASLLVGQIPPEPPTFRGRLGGFLVKIVHRALFWYTPPIVKFHQAATQSLNGLLTAVQTIEKTGQESLATIAGLNRQVKELHAETERLKEILEMRQQEFQALIKMELSPETQAEAKAQTSPGSIR